MTGVLDDPRLAERYLFPRPAPPPDPFVVPVDGAELACWRSPRREGAPLLLHFHGNGEVVDDYVDWLAPAWIALGFDVVLAEYRGYGGSTGAPTVGLLLDDALAVYDAVGEPCYVYGRSVGSLPAVHVAAQREVLGLVLESAIADAHERLALRSEGLFTDDELREAVAERLDQRAKLLAYDGPTLVMHARRDHLVDVTHATRLAEWSAGRLAVFDRGDHNSVLSENLETMLELLVEFAGLDEGDDDDEGDEG